MRARVVLPTCEQSPLPWHVPGPAAGLGIAPHMTLLLTEVSTHGIAMISDTKVIWVNKVSGLIDPAYPPRYQRKLFKLPPLGSIKLSGAVSYWGAFGLIIEDPVEFENWIGGMAQFTQATSLMGFAEELAEALNVRCSGKILAQPVGFHLAGYDRWHDIFPRPTFIHVHNGHLHQSLTLDSKNYVAVAPTGSANLENPVTWNEGMLRKIVAHHTGKAFIVSEQKAATRGPFSVHRDFPDMVKSDAENRRVLDNGYLTANGDYFRVTIKREREALDVQRDKMPAALPATDPGYPDQRLAWMVASAQAIEKEVKQEGAIQWFGGSYQELMFNMSEFKVARGLGFDA